MLGVVTLKRLEVLKALGFGDFNREIKANASLICYLVREMLLLHELFLYGYYFPFRWQK